MYCHKCELAYDAHARFCHVCGLPLSFDEATPRFDGSPSYPASLASNLAKKPEGPRGLGGWLILVGIGLLFGLVNRSFAVVRTITLFTKGTVQRLSVPQSVGYIPGNTGIMEFTLGVQIAFLAFNILLAILFTKESRSFPRWFVAFLCLSVISGGVNHWFFSHAVAGSSVQVQERLQPALHYGFLRVIGAGISATLWTVYMTRSRRVKATFVL
jgi:Protein of unknown function (DUF2569)